MSKKYRPIIKEGTHLASSKETDGTYRGALLDNYTNKVVGQAEWELIEEDNDCNWNYPNENYNDDRNSVLTDEERKELVKFLSDLISEVIIHVGSKALPYIARWWNDKGAPAANKAWNKITRKNKKKKGNKNNTCDTTSGISIQTITTLDFLSRDINVALEDYSKNLTSEEAQKHLVNIVILATLLANEIRSLSGACIKENGEMSEQYLEWKNAFEKLTTQKITDSINSILESNVSLLDESKMRNLSEILGYNLIEEGQFVPIKNNKLKEALLLK